ncbi:MAG: hypothetical protein ACYCX2_05010 [Christensenellales bacterium]
MRLICCGADYGRIIPEESSNSATAMRERKTTHKRWEWVLKKIDCITDQRRSVVKK